jgi:hypothetical protein
MEKNIAKQAEALIPSEAFFERFGKYFMAVAIIVLGWVARTLYERVTDLEDRYKKHLEQDAAEWKVNGIFWNQTQRKIHDSSDSKD